jgi:hypothetical protein
LLNQSSQAKRALKEAPYEAIGFGAGAEDYELGKIVLGESGVGDDSKSIQSVPE